VSAVGLVMAKAPVPGQVKTRLARTVGAERAATLACAALLDTLDVCEAVFAHGRRVLALTGGLAQAVGAPELLAALAGWQVIAQHGAGLGARIANAHRDVHALVGAPVVQIGMDTPHLPSELLAKVADRAQRRGRPILGPADDGGWWVLASPVPTTVDHLDRVPMSRPDTGAATLRALSLAGSVPVLAPTLGDVDTADDAERAAAAAPHTRFARAWLAGDASLLNCDASLPDGDGAWLAGDAAVRVGRP
jgi:glycosyltransferase A (GT-A) superfamily protein (DUF2064 family)